MCNQGVAVKTAVRFWVDRTNNLKFRVNFSQSDFLIPLFATKEEKSLDSDFYLMVLSKNMDNAGKHTKSINISDLLQALEH